jgi:hypothetical protein
MYALLSATYLILSGAPARVHVLSLATLAVAFLVPSIWATHFSHRAPRLAICGLFAIAAMLLWDASAHFVIVKAEPFSILLSNAWLYLAGLIALALLSFGVSWAAMPPNSAVKRDAPQAARPLP